VVVWRVAAVAAAKTGVAGQSRGDLWLSGIPSAGNGVPDAMRRKMLVIPQAAAAVKRLFWYEEKGGISVGQR